LYTDLDNFTAAVERLRDLSDRGLMRLILSPQGFGAFEFDVAASDEVPPAGDGLYSDLEDVISAVAGGAPVETFVEIRSRRRPGFEDPEDAEVSRTKYGLVATELVSSDLRRRTWLRATSKVHMLVGQDWEVVARRADSTDRTDLDNLRYGLLRLTSERRTGDGDMPLPAQPDRVTTVIGLDITDLDGLMGALSRLRDAMLQDGGSEGGGDGGR
jgi:hypothetical protein